MEQVTLSPHTQRNINKVKVVQRRSTRYVMKGYSRYSSVTTMLQELELYTLEQRQSQARLIMFFKVVHGLIDIPEDRYLKPVSVTTRGHLMRYLQPRARILSYQHSFSPATTAAWNQLNNAVVSAPSLEVFRARLMATAKAQMC